MGRAYPHKLQHRPQGRRPLRLRVAGVTLPELLIGVAIVSVLAGMAGSSYPELIAGQRTRTASTDLYLALTKARSEAIKRNTSVTLSPKGDPGGTNWAGGWEIANPTPAATDKLEEHPAFSNLTITGPTSVVYQSSGRIRGNARPQFNFSVADTSAAACVTVDLSGLPAQKSSSC